MVVDVPVLVDVVVVELAVAAVDVCVVRDVVVLVHLPHMIGH